MTYVEGFAGSAALFFAKKMSDVEVINDIDSGLINFYRVIRDPDQFEELVHLLNLTPYSREEFTYCKMTWTTCEDEMEKARRWFVMIRHSYGAVGNSFSASVTDSCNGKAQTTAAYLAAVARLPEIHARLQGVQIENKDFRDLITTYDRPTTFFYLDPPYVLSTRCGGKMYAHEMSDDDHKELVDLLLGINGKVMLSGYANPLYVPLEKAGWQRYDFQAVCAFAAGADKTESARTRKAKTNGKARVESVWVRR